MKLSISLTLLFLTTYLFSQDLKTLHPAEGESFEFGIDAHNDWKLRDQLLDDLANDKKIWDSLTVEEDKLFQKWDETYESMWAVEGGGCSWYCGAGDYTVTTSSELASSGEISYSSKNLTGS